MRGTRLLTLGFLLLAMFPAAILAGGGVAVLQTADPSCRDDSGDTYVDCGNGTVTDNRTGLVWLANANCLSGRKTCSASGTTCIVNGDCPAGETCVLRIASWFTAMEFAAGLRDIPAGSGAAALDCGLSDGSSPGEWRLPSVDEWEAMVADANGDPAPLDCSPAITNDSGDGCWTPAASSFSGVQAGYYWSSTTRPANPSNAWYMSLYNGTTVTDFYKGADFFPVWPVRGGQ